MKYWKNGFYDEPIASAAEITDEYWQELLDGQASGLQIVTDADGSPVLREPAEPTPGERSALRIEEMKSYLNATDWCVIKCLETGTLMPEAYPGVYAAREAARTEINECQKQEQP